MAKNTHYVGSSGEHLVASYFLKNNIGVYMPTTPNEKDLLVNLGDETGYVGVQVKTQSRPMPEKRRNKRYRFGFMKKNTKTAYSHDVPIFCCVALDKKIIQFFINDGVKLHYHLPDIYFTEAMETKTFNAVLDHFNYHE
jgi:hypothetical protein